MLESLLYSAHPGLALFAVIAISAVTLHLSSRSRTRRYPPGPPGQPFIGHLRDLATKPPHLYYTELKKIYGTHHSANIVSRPVLTVALYENSGDVVHVSALGQPIILIGSWEAANQLLGKRGSIYSDRPAAPFSSFLSVFLVQLLLSDACT